MKQKPICIIPARGGSKRIPRKNISPFNGKPLITWSIDCALKSNLFDRIIVSTDDDEIQKIALHAGAEVPFVRSAELANDFASTADVLMDALSKVENTHHTCCLYPTAPLLKPEDFQLAYQELLDKNADSIISVTDFDFHPMRAFEVGEQSKLSFKWPENAMTRSQDLPTLLHDAGAFYFFNTEQFKSQKSLMMRNTIGYPIERMRAVDIDTPEDFDFAEMLHKNQTKNA